jgi:hypothetical protein
MNRLIKQLTDFNLNKSQIDRIIGMGKVRTVKNNVILIEHNNICDKVYYLLKGAFVCRYINEEKEIQKTVNFFMEGSHTFFTCADGFLTSNPTNCELRAIRSSQVIEFDRKDIDILINEDIDIFKYYHFKVKAGLIEENELKIKIITESSENLYNYLVAEYPNLLANLSTKYIAEFMGITPEWLSKIKRNQLKG